MVELSKLDEKQVEKQLLVEKLLLGGKLKDEKLSLVEKLLLGGKPK